MNRSPGFHHISNATLQLRVHWRLRRDPGHIQSSPSITRRERRLARSEGHLLPYGMAPLQPKGP
jgi:hypothetical protein